VSKLILTSFFALILSSTIIACAEEKNVDNLTNKTIESKNMPNTTKLATESIVLGMGCFWGAEKRMSEINGVIDVQSGYAGGDDTNGNYHDVLALEKQIAYGRSNTINHSEVVKVTFNPQQVSLKEILIAFWENHNPTQGNRQGNDVGSNYRSAIYYQNEQQAVIAKKTKEQYQTVMSKNKFGKITTEIAMLRNYNAAEGYHQDYLKKNPNGYCGLGGTGISYPRNEQTDKQNKTNIALDSSQLNQEIQLIVYESNDCHFCQKFKEDILNTWKSTTPIKTTESTSAPTNWKLRKTIFATPTIVLFKAGKEVERFTGYAGDKMEFWQWLGKNTLEGEEARIAFQQATERAGTGLHLKENRNGDFVDPISGEVLFKSNTKFKSGTGWPSFSEVEKGAVTLHEDRSHGMLRTEVRSASSGIHLGHLFNDGPTASGKRFCINGNVLKFMPKEEQK
jgi:peptide methionine sulfoxide reductase msrA/msrB